MKIKTLLTITFFTTVVSALLCHQFLPRQESSSSCLTYVNWIGEDSSKELHLTGGKGASLSHLQSVKGIQVPEGFILNTAAYSDWLANNREIQPLLSRLDELSVQWSKIPKENLDHQKQLESSINKQCELIRDKIISSSIPSLIVQEIEKSYLKLSQLCNSENLSVAVRSSATMEDLPTASFAGQHDTYLNQSGIDQLVDSIKRCWASLYHFHTVQYRNTLLDSLKEQKIDNLETYNHSNVKLAVVIQRVIHPQAAGVGFNITPTGEDECYIEANYGLGESVVQGSVNPDSWNVEFDQFNIKKFSIGEKQIETISDDRGGIKTVLVDEIKRETPCLDDRLVQEIARSITQIGEYYQSEFAYKYIDTEFAVDKNGAVYFVQARPETVFSNKQSSNRIILGISKEEKGKANLLFHGGKCGFPGSITGRLIFAESVADAVAKIQTGDILVTHETSPEWSFLFPRLSGVIVDVGGLLSHTAIVGRENQLPTILSSSTATEALKKWDGETITLDATNMSVYEGKLSLEKGPLTTFQEGEEDLSNNACFYVPADLKDESGEWLFKPRSSISKLQRSIYLRAFNDLGKSLNCPLPTRVIGDQIFTQIKDSNDKRVGYLKLTDYFLTLDIDQLEEILNARLDAITKISKLASEFKNPTLNDLKLFNLYYQEWIENYLLRGRYGHGCLESLLQKNLEQISDPIQLDLYLKMKFPQRNTTMEKEVEATHLRQELKKIGIASNSTIEHVKAVLSKDHPDLNERIIQFALSYEHTLSSDFREEIPFDLTLSNLLQSLDSRVKNSDLTLDELQVKELDQLFEDHPEILKIFLLSHRHVYQKENEHNQMAKINFQFQEGFLNLGKSLADDRKLDSPEDVFNREIEELIEMIG